MSVFTLAVHASGMVKLCDDESAWPPYTYRDPQQPDNVIGASVDLISGILIDAGYQPQISLLPWKRCQAEVEAGRFQMLLDASNNNERARKFLVSRPYYRVLTVLFYLKTRVPVPQIKSLNDMIPYRYCGMLGYSYKKYHFPVLHIDTGSRDLASLFEKLRLNRCDLVLAGREITDYLQVSGQLNMDDMAQIAIPDAKPLEYHVMISRSDRLSTTLLKIIDEGIARAMSDGRYARIFRQYGAEGRMESVQ